MARQLDDVHNLLRSHHAPILTGFLDMGGKPMRFGDIEGGIVQADDGSMDVEVGLHGHGVAQLLGQPEAVREEHEGAGQDGIELAVPVPETAVVEVFGAVVGLVHVYMFEDLVEDVADHDGAGEGRVRRPTEEVWDSTCRLFSAIPESLLGAWQTRRYLETPTGSGSDTGVTGLRVGVLTSV